MSIPVFHDVLDDILDCVVEVFIEATDPSQESTYVSPPPMNFFLTGNGIPYSSRLAEFNIEEAKLAFFDMLGDNNADSPWASLRYRVTHEFIDLEEEEFVEGEELGVTITPIDDAVSLVSRVSDPLMEVIQYLPERPLRSVMTLEVVGDDVPPYLKPHLQFYLRELTLKERRDIVACGFVEHLSGRDGKDGWLDSDEGIETLTEEKMDNMGVPRTGLAVNATYPEITFGQQLASVWFNTALLAHLTAYAMGVPPLEVIVNTTQLLVHRGSVDWYDEAVGNDELYLAYDEDQPQDILLDSPNDVVMMAC